MTNERNTDGLELEAVVRGFSEAQTTLASLGEELQQISKLGEEQQETKSVLVEATKQISDFARNAGVQLEGLADAQSQVESILKAGAEILSGSQLAEVTSKVENLSASLDTMRKELSDKVENLSASLDAMRQELSEQRKAAEVSHGQLMSKIVDSDERIIEKLDEVTESLKRVDNRVSRSIFGRIL